ncbi:hypothetical protein H4R99_004922 [Coemansia sp. RSA 1722]|nr:hypothetical protein H4R99_004922 [Coemansia sp. RSA 1722]
MSFCHRSPTSAQTSTEAHSITAHGLSSRPCAKYVGVAAQEEPLFVWQSVTNWVSPREDVPAGGWTEEESIELAKRLVNEAVDLVDFSTSGSSPKESTLLSPGYQVRFATSIRNEVLGMLTGAVGLITDAVQANDILEQEKADLVFSGRALLRKPNFVLDGALKLGVFPQYPDQYERGRNKTKLSFVHIWLVSYIGTFPLTTSLYEATRCLLSAGGYSTLVTEDHEKLKNPFKKLATKWNFDLDNLVSSEKLCDPFTGTYEYMSIRILSGAIKKNGFDYMESLFYVIIHIMQCVEKERITDFLDTRCLPNSVAACLKGREQDGLISASNTISNDPRLESFDRSAWLQVFETAADLAKNGSQAPMPYLHKLRTYVNTDPNRRYTSIFETVVEPSDNDHTNSQGSDHDMLSRADNIEPDPESLTPRISKKRPGSSTDNGTKKPRH